MPNNWNVQWLNANSQRSYPLTDWATKTATENTDVVLPDSFVVALYFPVHAGLDVEVDQFFVRNLTIEPIGYTLSIGYNDGTADGILVGTVGIPVSTHEENRTYAIAGADNYDDSVGQVCIGSLTEAALLPPGDYTFAPEAGALEVDAIWPEIRGISSLVVVNGGDRSPRIVGDIELVAGSNMSIVAALVGDETPTITFNAIEGAGLNEECVCDEGDVDGDCIRFINGIPPLADGNYRMLGDDCITLQPINNGFLMIDECSKPCCGCEELDALTRQIDRFADGVLTFQNFVNTLGSEVTQMSNVVLGSRLGDQGCVEC